MTEEGLGVASREDARPQPEAGVAASPLKSHFTLVFEGDLRSFERNPHQTDTPFGRPIIAGMGNAFAEFDDFCATRDELLEALKQTWRVLRMAGLLNLTRGVQLGQTSWYVKIRDAEELSDAAIAKAEGRS